MSAPVRRLTAECLGTAVLVAAVVGSGIAAVRLSPDVGLELLINALATVAALGVLIVCLGPVSGAQFNPAVTLVAAARREMAAGEAAGYVGAQIVGGLAGVAVANLMFGLPAWTQSTHRRDGHGVLLGEVVATAGLLLVIGTLTRTDRGHLGAVAVPAWIGSAYFFTASTSFANPAVTIARALTDTFAGIAPADVGAFVAAQLVGAAVGAGLTEVLHPRHGVPEPLDLPEAIHGRP
ncbi:MAG TPA: MIP/aquaporin family protein [Actinomycetes bacterium]|nr:MIP/aquaporin family protein [Actinomycetes bacterium]